MPKRTLDDRLAGDAAELDTKAFGSEVGEDDGEAEDAAAMVNGRDEPGVVFVLEQASLEIGKVGKVRNCPQYGHTLLALYWRRMVWMEDQWCQSRRHSYNSGTGWTVYSVHAQQR